ncbi:MAG: hypothetical protein A2571_02370 [Candidatus Vogelbacteria bacterium RIFOXYD1_FULL_44_32]|uniref:Uncharacterized protein n=1 Tax=Candidatus Vogelbacteria bacterium RIFOXYD1_FULL_44_32 TaxID=1802438 RepID=A0A1G2QF15_9BACT|nr:MAG: hypothetical protein A2571_02370 [Candidatus Vogelbacteria bacterium RIFOXYD1_FULL_44_32]
MSEDMSHGERQQFLQRELEAGAVVTLGDIKTGVQELICAIENNNRPSYNPTRMQMMWYLLAKLRAPHLLQPLHQKWFLPEGGSPTFRPVGYEVAEVKRVS